MRSPLATPKKIPAERQPKAAMFPSWTGGVSALADGVVDPSRNLVLLRHLFAPHFHSRVVLARWHGELLRKSL